MSSPAKGYGLWRTEDPKYAQYANDGNGRDTFISFHNGGFLNKNENVFPKTGVHIAEHKKFSNLQSPRTKAPAPHHYLADGTGRDWYVLANHGGMIERYKDTGDKTSIYAKVLRQNERVILKNSPAVSNSPMMSPRSYLDALDSSRQKNFAFDFQSPRKTFQTNMNQNGTNFWYTEKEQNMEKIASIQQRKHAVRMSVPKRTHSKWEEQIEDLAKLNKSTDFASRARKSPRKQSNLMKGAATPQIVSSPRGALNSGAAAAASRGNSRQSSQLINSAKQPLKSSLNKMVDLQTSNQYFRSKLEQSRNILDQLRTKNESSRHGLEMVGDYKSRPSVMGNKRDQRKIFEQDFTVDKERRLLYNLAKRNQGNIVEQRDSFNKTINLLQTKRLTDRGKIGYSQGFGEQEKMSRVMPKNTMIL